MVRISVPRIYGSFRIRARVRIDVRVSLMVWVRVRCCVVTLGCINHGNFKTRCAMVVGRCRFLRNGGLWESNPRATDSGLDTLAR